MHTEFIPEHNRTSVPGDIYDAESNWDCVVKILDDAYKHRNEGNVCVQPRDPVDDSTDSEEDYTCMRQYIEM